MCAQSIDTRRELSIDTPGGLAFVYQLVFKGFLRWLYSLAVEQSTIVGEQRFDSSYDHDTHTYKEQGLCYTTDKERRAMTVKVNLADLIKVAPKRIFSWTGGHWKVIPTNRKILVNGILVFTEPRADRFRVSGYDKRRVSQRLWHENLFVRVTTDPVRASLNLFLERW